MILVIMIKVGTIVEIITKRWFQVDAELRGK